MSSRIVYITWQPLNDCHYSNGLRFLQTAPTQFPLQVILSDSSKLSPLEGLVPQRETR
jgi:hypothetical protein